MDFLDEDEFDEENEEEDYLSEEREEPVELPDEYVVKESVCKHKQLCQILAVYYHAKHQEPMSDVFEHLKDTTFIETPIQSLHFYLDQNREK